MCTVTYVPMGEGFIFTSNRDEQGARKTIVPAHYKEKRLNLFYPRDEVAGGTWIGLSEEKRLACLLNGGFLYHDPALKFSKSRGLVVTSILTNKDFLSTFKKIHLAGVAPFTLVVLDWRNTKKIYELVWCQGKKKVKSLMAEQPCIWSSSTLYDCETKALREKWFEKEVVSSKGVKINTVLNFHQNKNLGNVEIAPQMKRSSVETVSTTMVVYEGSQLSVDYYDYLNQRVLKYDSVFTEPIKR